MVPSARLRTETGVQEITLPTSQARQVAISPDGKTLAAKGDALRIGIMDLTGPIPVERAQLEDNTYSSLSRGHALVFSPDGSQLVSLVQQGQVTLWDMKTNRKLREWKIPSEVQSAAFAVDGRHLALGNQNGTIYVLRLERS